MPVLENATWVLILWAAIAYLIGSVPFGLIVTRAMGLADPRTLGSGNIGATNVLRTGSKLAGASTLILDAAKGAVAVLAARLFAGEDAAQIAALAAFVGHCYPVWLRFTGGKGVATFLGVLLALIWPVGLLTCATWIAAVALSRISSVGALTAAVLSSGWMLLLARPDTLAVGLLMTVLMFWRHRQNLARLRAGTEPRLGQCP
ncbi:glycerol-3-phosphate acyltransferase [Roseivivax halodurans JCM 10272]|uniref:Glycerol-3-phosphate acyltransferase n=1 Tax=Roseivivax halodurans JCM 10272 TaxID=1449350 RepID=X7EI85_9RHOB|nr:glycerol-3-phosphate 1-O-acyltransferase PlsY [Roseivivax halodurans]ETX14848.1 glycerol-3-phosphate acyltransferase [Roseivivax halodurans JCM 10272]